MLRVRVPVRALLLQELAERTASGRALGPLTCLAGTPHARQVAPVPCHFFHPGQACIQHPLSMLLPAYSRALSVYLPVYLLPAVLVHRQQLLKRPLPILTKCLQGVARCAPRGWRGVAMQWQTSGRGQLYGASAAACAHSASLP